MEQQRFAGIHSGGSCNRTNEQYREKGLALIQKIPTPITPVRMDKENRILRWHISSNEAL